MARRPSSRRHKLNSEVDLDITPIMNLMIVLVPFLLLAAVFSKTSILNLYLPSQEDSVSADIEDLGDELSISVAVTSLGFKLGGVPDENIADINLKDNKFDYKMLSEELNRVKNKYNTTDNIVLLIEQDIDYDTIVHTMDATREIKIDKKTTILFPNVSLADSIILVEEENQETINTK